MNEVRGPLVLTDFAVDPGPELDVERFGELVGRDQRRPQRLERVQALRVAQGVLGTLEGLALEIAGRDVVGERVAGHVPQRVVLVDGGATDADHGGQLDLVVDLVGRDNGQHDLLAGTDDGASGRQEEHRLGRRLDAPCLEELPRLLDVAVEVDAHADDLAGAEDRRAEGDVAGRAAPLRPRFANGAEFRVRSERLAEVLVGEVEDLEFAAGRFAGDSFGRREQSHASSTFAGVAVQ